MGGGPTVQLLLCRLWIQKSSPAQDGSSHICDILALFLHNDIVVRIYACQSPVVESDQEAQYEMTTMSIQFIQIYNHQPSHCFLPPVGEWK